MLLHFTNVKQVCWCLNRFGGLAVIHAKRQARNKARNRLPHRAAEPQTVGAGSVQEGRPGGRPRARGPAPQGCKKQASRTGQAKAAMCDNYHPMKNSILITKRIYPEAVELLRLHADVDYVDSDD